MGYPAAGTIEAPRDDPALAAVVASALADPDGARDELVRGLTGGAARAGHLCANAWVFDRDLSAVLLVCHPRFSWTIPGGHLDPGEAPVDGARRELAEETGLHAELCTEVPVALVATMLPPAGGHPGHVHYTLSYAFYADRDAQLCGEDGQPVRWFDLGGELPEGFFGDNHHAHRHAALLRSRT